MLGFLRLMLFWSVASAAINWLLLIYSRSLRREALEKEWDAAHPLETDSAAREAFIAEGMVAYEHSLKRKLLIGVVVLPFLAIALLLYLVNYA